MSTTSAQKVNWIGTLNNPDGVVVQEFLERWVLRAKAVYVCGQLERGEEGTVHVQYHINFKKPG